MQIGILKFKETYVERIWGGKKLQQLLERSFDAPASIGEAWLIADHPSCESVVAEGMSQGKTLRDLMETQGDDLIGALPHPTPDGRFPLLLKLIDAGTSLSVQVHPDDVQAKQLKEADAGKTEMWYVLEANRGSTLLSGVGDDVTRDSFLKELPTGNIAKLLHSFPVSKGDSVFVAAGTVHAIGEGILLAEIQQNSDITYRLFDWNRVDAQGNTRELHTEKALKVMDFAHAAADSTKVLSYTEQGVTHEVLAACPYFAAERLIAEGTSKFETAGKSFHILQALDMPVGVLAGDSKCVLAYGEAALIPANTGTWSITGGSPLLHYYVPDLQEDIIAPLRRHGHSTEKIYGIGGLHRS